MKKICETAICNTCMGVVQGAFGLSLYTAEETREIHHLQNLASSVIEKSPEMVTDPAICKAIREGQQAGLENFAKNAPSEAVTVGVVTAANLVCSKAFKDRFREILMGACLNLTGCA